MKILGLAGLVLALAIVGYLVVGYLDEVGKAQDAVQTLPGSQPGQPADVTKSGLERRLSPILDQARKRADDTDNVAGQ